ncbi:MAG TPA: DUF937 domain-containing protein [Chloroflexaceae bacterium]|nr:DUF937 domain-containing protein [Chloroflexaceae bacterium]
MASILTTLTTLITPNVITTLGKQFGLSDELTRQGLALANAVLAGGMARQAATPDGAAGLATLIDGADTSVLSNLSGLLAGAPAKSDLAAQLYGSNLELVTGGVKKAAGVDIAPIMGLVAPVLMAVTKNVAAQQGVGADGLGKLLQGELRSLARSDPATAKVLKEVFKPLDAQDKVRAAYSDEEWTKLQHGPLNAATLIILADRSGRGGRRQETEAMQAALETAVAAAGPAELISLLFRDGITDDEVEELVKAFRKTDEAAMHSALLAPIGEAVAIARAKASKSDAMAYQGLLVTVAQEVAGAAKEGGFLGIGGTNVSADEKAAIDALVTAVNAA